MRTFSVFVVACCIILGMSGAVVASDTMCDKLNGSFRRSCSTSPLGGKDCRVWCEFSDPIKKGLNGVKANTVHPKGDDRCEISSDRGAFTVDCRADLKNSNGYLVPEID